MITKYCKSCGRATGHKRAIGWGTFFASVLTGFWLFLIPFYPKRCVVCGTTADIPIVRAKFLIFVILSLVLAFILLAFILASIESCESSKDASLSRKPTHTAPSQKPMLTTDQRLSNSGDAYPQPTADIGKKLYEKIKKGHPDTFIEPGFYSAMFDPYIYIAVPEREWNSLTKADKISLCLYTKNLVPILRSSPQNYLPFLAFGDTPVVSKMYQKVRAMCDDCWAIMVGQITDKYIEGKRDIILDKIVVVGDPVYEVMKKEGRAYSAVSFTDFCK